MNRDFLDRAEFNVGPVQLPKVQADTVDKINDTRNDVRVKGLKKLVFLIVMLGIILLGGRLIVEYSFSFCRGETHQSFEKISKGISEEWKK